MTGPGRRTRAAVGRLSRALNHDPGVPGTRRTLHHGARGLLLLGLAVITYLFFPTPQISDFAGLERGVVAPEDIIAQFDFQIPKSEDEVLREQAEAAAAVPPVFDYVPAAEDSVLSRLGGFFAASDSVTAEAREDSDEDGDDDLVLSRAALRSLLDQAGISLSAGALDVLTEPVDRDRLRRATETAVRQLFPLGITVTSAGPEGVVRVRREGEDPRLVPADSVYSQDRFLELAAERLPEDFGADAAGLQRALLQRHFYPSLALNQAQTEAARARARASVDTVRTTVLEGERIVAAREQVGDREEERLRAYQAALDARGLREGGGNLAAVGGAVLFNLLVLSILGLLLWFFHRASYHDMRTLLLLAGLVAVTVGAASLIARFELPVELVPVTFAVLIVAVLFGGRLALFLALVIALLLGGQQPFLGLSAPFAAAVGGAAAAFSVRAMRRRSQGWVYIGIISTAYILTALTLGLLRSREATDVLLSMGWGVTNAVVSSLLAIGFLPLLESVARVTTDQTLLELSDLNRPRLKRLSLEASGTYAHTINVSNLSEASCNAIGANGLLARVGVYYHDIGKLVKPQYFVENQPRGRNPHDKLKPSMSASIIRSHVVEGLRMAEEDRLPEVVKDFIAEHHGTQQISFFYQKAREMDPEGELNPADFSYPGPKPQTRESAVVMLADSVESAARVLSDPSPSRLRALVNRIVEGKISAGQLDQCPLTMRDIDMVKESLANVLNGMYHHRIDYPVRGVPRKEPEPEQEQVRPVASAPAAGP